MKNSGCFVALTFNIAINQRFLRDKPNGKVLVKVPLKSSVLAEEDESWTKVTYNGVTGWMMSKYISKGNG